MAACEAPLARGPLKGRPATGTDAGYLRHRRAGEPSCDPCRQAHNEAMPKYKRTYRAKPENQAKARAYAKDYYHANKKREYARMYAWRAANRERHAEYSRNWRQANPEKERELGRQREARLRRVARIPFSVEEFEERMSMFGHRCWMCAGPFETVDHVKPVSRGGPHCLSNLRPACRSCNSSKGDSWPIGEAA